MFAEHDVVRRVAADGLSVGGVWVDHRDGCHFFPKRLRLCSPVKHALGHVHDRAPVPFAEAVALRSAGRAKLMGDRRGLAVVTVVVGDEFAATIGTQGFEAKLERHDEVFE